MADCELCTDAGGELIWQDGFCRVVRVEDFNYPGFCRVILNSHIKEMTDLGTREGPLTAAIETAGSIDAHFAFSIQAKLLHTRLHVIECRFCPVVRATCRAVFALIQAEKNVILEVIGCHIFQL